ncbi:WhiB family redox-sensing transcriptional regulator [Streptomyces sp. SAI-117]|uniref:WhiB family transcriptional regulator n=1 Tax=unclassified Streptomyces TaxID=2593676 RepID=UPI002473007D|nr:MULTISPECIES: WhiB family transcriptional regulator [unclassified Streptomyces]MDH6553743.1 WhiB family redox-sensing transcriptional regulator [Streptomyces sp. SAI-041]MDH6572822.1 WhiB family redox-sensing transcriptional regulator [Streptomyces sp. SAI-117]MDH6582216.1 WhiB family redox-sensing transcriptional regulator [Streptomyces sp. SAI-133]
MSWRERAACRDVDPDLFFPIGTAGLTLVQIDEAKAVCARCPVRERCLQWALAVGQVEGVWGGTTESERRAARRRSACKDVEQIGAKAG